MRLYDRVLNGSGTHWLDAPPTNRVTARSLSERPLRTGGRYGVPPLHQSPAIFLCSTFSVLPRDERLDARN